MIKYRAMINYTCGGGSKITPVEVEKETEKSVWIKGNRHAKESGYAHYFDTWEDAKGALMSCQKSVIKRIRRELEVAKSVRVNIKGMEPKCNGSHECGSDVCDDNVVCYHKGLPKPEKPDSIKQLDFGDYALIEQKRFGADNEMYLHKVIGRLKSNTYVPVPVQTPAKEIIHKEIVDIVSCICCGVSERHALKYKETDVQKTNKFKN